jgi:hypothetical protein
MPTVCYALELTAAVGCALLTGVVVCFAGLMIWGCP